MRLLHCHSGNLFGGIERALLTLAAQRTSELVHDFALCFEGSFANELRALHHSPKLLGPVRYRLPWSVWSARRHLAQHVAATRPDWILTHSMWSLKLAYSVARQSNVPVGIWVHDALQGHSWLERPGQFSPDKIFANSRFTARGIPHVFPGRWPEVISPPLPVRVPDETSRDRVRAEFQATRETVVILIAGRFEPLKGHALLLNALSRVAVELPSSLRWSVWIAGEAQRTEERELKARLHSQALALGERVRFLGHRSDIGALYSAADLYCQPNVGPEAYGLTFAEAAAAGLPVLTSRLGAGPELVDNEIGRLVPPGDEIALAAALQELIVNSELRRRLGAEALLRSKSLPGPDAVARRLASRLQGAFESRLAG